MLRPTITSMHYGAKSGQMAIVACSLLLCVACSSRTTDTKKGSTNTSSSSARTKRSERALPAAPLGVYIGHFLGRDGQPSTKSALRGVDAQVQLHKKYNPLESDDTIALLTQFGTILQVNVPDMLNRSTDRPKTLTQYTDALRNITVRATRTAKDLSDHQEKLRADEKAQQSRISELNHQLDTAKRGGDLAGLASTQKLLATEQAALALIRAEAQQTKDMLASYQNLITISEKRQAAIGQNREILIAGLKVVSIPGIENLGVIQGNGTSAKSFLQGL